LLTFVEDFELYCEDYDGGFCVLCGIDYHES